MRSPWDGALEAYDILRKGPQPLSSHFSVSYGMALNLLQGRNAAEVEDLVARVSRIAAPSLEASLAPGHAPCSMGRLQALPCTTLSAARRR